MSTCRRCATSLQPGATVCATCCAPVDVAPAQTSSQTVFEAPKDNPRDFADRRAAVLSNWPFVSDELTEAPATPPAAVEHVPGPMPVPASLSMFVAKTSPVSDDNATSANSTHALGGVPSQRKLRPGSNHSVPSVGPNPFLGAVAPSADDADAASAL